MDWDQACAVAGEIARDWDVEDGPGGAVVLFDGDGIRGEAAGGLADLSHSLAFRTDTAIRYASVSKHFLAALLLGEDGIGLEDRLGRHLMLPPALAEVTVGRALDMTAGLPDLGETLALLGVPLTTAMSRHRLMDAVGLLDRLNFAPGTEISYSNTGYRLVQAALLARGMDYAAEMTARLFRPLGLSIRLPEDETEPVPNLATGYWKPLPGMRRGWRSGRYGMHFSASGGLAGNALDLAAWGRALLADQGPVRGVLDALTALRLLSDGRPTGYGLGLAQSRLGPHRFVGHGGSLPGYRSHLLLDRAAGAGVGVLSNRDDTDAGGLALRVMAGLHGVEVPATATGLLPEGMFVTEDGPFWLQHRAGQACFLGATERLTDGGEGWAVNGSAPLPMRLAADGDGITGEIGHVARRFRPVAARVRPNVGWAGRYVAELGGQVLQMRVEVAREQARLRGPPLGQWLDLRPVDGTRALAQREGAWSQQFCVCFDADGMTLVTQRSRVVRFTKR